MNLKASLKNNWEERYATEIECESSEYFARYLPEMHERIKSFIAAELEDQRKTYKAITDAIVKGKVEDVEKLLTEARQALLSEIDEILRHMMLDYANTIISERKNGWDWLSKARDNIVLLKSKKT